LAPRLGWTAGRNSRAGCRSDREGLNMYGWIFRHLPGPLWLRIVTSVVLLAAALVLMVQFLFPWMSEYTQFTDSTIGAASQP